MTNKKLLSILVPSRRLDQLKGLVESLQKTVTNPRNIELVCKLDSDMEGAEKYIKKLAKTVDFDIKYIISERLGGVFTLWVGCNEIFDLSDPSSYFVTFLTDEARFLTKGWDQILEKYKGYYPDNLFRLRLSPLTRYWNYSNVYECTYAPEGFPIYTRNWLELAEGVGNCWGSDAYNQLIAFHLSLGTKGYDGIWCENKLYRDIVCETIQIGGIDVFAQDITEEQRSCYTVRNELEWMRLVTYEMQLRYAYIARRMYLYVFAHKNGVKKFRLIKLPATKIIQLYDIEENKIVCDISYELNKRIIFLKNTGIYLKFIFNYIDILAGNNILKEFAKKIKKKYIHLSRIFTRSYKEEKSENQDNYLHNERNIVFPGTEWFFLKNSNLLKKVWYKILYRNIFKVMKKTGYPIASNDGIKSALQIVNSIEKKYEMKVFIHE